MRRHRFILGVLWFVVPLVTTVLLVGMAPGPAGDADGPGSSAIEEGGYPGLTSPVRQPSGSTQPSGDAGSAPPGVSRSPGSTQPPDSTKPNIVVIMLDDMRTDDLNGPWMRKTRQLLGAQGVRFANTFVPLPLCCPARSSFLTGQYPHNHGVWEHAAPWGYPALDDSETLPVWLQRAGYNTAFLGKYLNGYNGQDPDTGTVDGPFYVPPGWSDWKGSLGLEGTYDYRDTVLNDNGWLRSLSGRYQTRAYGQIGEGMIQKWAAKPKPFFFWLNFAAPHTGLPCEREDPGCVFGGTNPILDAEDPRVGGSPAVPPDRRGRFDHLVQRAPGVDVASDLDSAGKPAYVRNRPSLTTSQRDGLLELTRQRYEAVSVVDDQMATLMAALRRTGELDNTVVMFTSDNGFFLGEHRIRIGKRLPYEPSLRIPLLMRGPGIPAGQVRTDPFSMIDFAPTILDLAGAEADRPTDGISMLPVIRGGDRGWARPILTETGPRNVEAALEPDGTPIDYNADHPNALSPTQGVRVKGLMYIESTGGYRELYDLRVDPHEMDNVVGEPRYRPEVRALAAVLDRLRGCVGAECEIRLPPVLRSAAPAQSSTGAASPTPLSSLRR